jgi:hypothetical protein
MKPRYLVLGTLENQMVIINGKEINQKRPQAINDSSKNSTGLYLYILFSWE